MTQTFEVVIGQCWKQNVAAIADGMPVVLTITEVFPWDSRALAIRGDDASTLKIDFYTLRHSYKLVGGTK